MPYMRVGGITVGVASARKRHPAVGRRRTSGRGAQEDTRRGDRSKDEWDIGTSPLPAAEAESLSAILTGFSHVWSLDGSWASSGSAGVRAQNGLRFIFGGGPFAGSANYTRVETGVDVDFVGNLGDLWTVLVVRKDTTWKHYAFRSTGDYAVNGVVQADPTLPWFTKQSNGDLRFSGLTDAGANANLDLGQIVAIPAVLPDTHVVAATAWLTRRWAAMPVLDVSGSFLGARSYMLMRATVKPGDHVAGPTERRVVSFHLRQAEGV